MAMARAGDELYDDGGYDGSSFDTDYDQHYDDWLASRPSSSARRYANY